MAVKQKKIWTDNRYVKLGLGSDIHGPGLGMGGVDKEKKS